MEFAADAQEKGLLAGRYRMGQLLGSGGFGAVYYATDQRLHRPVAIKICSARRLAADEAQEAAMLFEREALTLARLRHTGLTAIWDYFNIDDDWFLVMEYVPGETLRDRMRRAPGPLPLGEALHYASQICQVLQYLHSQHPPIVFRDLKPGNIMITPDERVKLIDFGIARLFSPDKQKDTVQFGTPGYAPPEQYGGQTEPRSDVYSLGVVLHQMVTGHNPASSPFRLPPARALNGAVSEAFEQLVEDATEYRVERRIGNAAQFCSRLEVVRSAPAMTQLLPQTGTITPKRSASEQAPRALHNAQAWPHNPRTLPKRPAKDGFGHGLLVSLLVVLMLGAVGTAGYFIHNGIDSLDQVFARASSSAPSTASPVPSSIAGELPSRLVFTAQTKEGGRNLFTARVVKDRERNGVTELAVEDIEQRTFFENGVEVELPAISPNGEQIAYAKVHTPENSGQQRSEVWIMDVEGNDDSKRVLTSYDFASAPAWSPNGTHLAAEVVAPVNPGQRDDEVAAPLNLGRRDIVILDLQAQAGAAQTLVNTNAWEGGPTWSPDGEQIAYHAQVGKVNCLQLFKINVKSGEPQQLIDLAEYDCSEQQSGDQWPDWGVKGITFMRRNLAQPNVDEQRTDRVAVLDPNQPTTSQITLFRNEINVGNGSEVRVIPTSFGRWARGGTYLLFEEERDDGYGLGYLDLNTKDAQGRYPLSILELENYTEVHFADWW